MSLMELQKNTPKHSMDQVRANMFINPQTYLAKVERLTVEIESVGILNLDEVFGIVVEGIPYIQLEKDSISKDLVQFNGMKVRGEICYFEYEKEHQKKIKITAYNPLTGTPFRTGYVTRKEQIPQKKMMHFGSGEVEDFNRGNFLEWITDDAILSRAVRELTEDEVEGKLFKALLIYDDRKKWYIIR